MFKVIKTVKAQEYDFENVFFKPIFNIDKGECNFFIFLFGIINNVLNDLINFFWQTPQFCLREKLGQNDRPHTGNKSLLVFDINIYLAR